MVANGQTAASAIWITANQAIFLPFNVGRRTTYNKIIWMNGATVSGNIDVGIYDIAGAKLASSGSTAQSGTSAPQVITITNGLLLNPGRYFLAICMDNTTGTLVRVAPNPTSMRAAGCRQRATSFVLPADASSFAGFTQSGYMPLISILEGTWG